MPLSVCCKRRFLQANPFGFPLETEESNNAATSGDAVLITHASVHSDVPILHPSYVHRGYSFFKVQDQDHLSELRFG